jgi:hypothetical protein
MAINSPLLEDVSINGATGILVNITGGPDLTLAEVTEACTLIQESADPDANIIFGSVIDPNMTDEVRLTVIATGFQSRTAVEASTATGVIQTRPKKSVDYQMSLPISYGSPVPGRMPPRASQIATAAPPPVPALARTSLAISSSAPPPVVISAPTRNTVSEVVEFADTAVDDYDITTSYPASALMYTPAPVMVTPAPCAPVAVSDRMASVPDSRPVIRPAVTSPIVAAPVSGPRRTSGTVPVALGSDHLCIEESEFDRPTYLRRAMAGDQPLAARHPGEGSKL